MAAEQDDLEFLRNQVHRLNAALSKYHSRHPQPVGRATGEHGALNPDGPKPSWLYNKSLLVPLLSEYDDVISQQQRELQTRQEALQGLSTKLQEVCSQNSRLHQLVGGGRGLDVDLVEHLQRQVESLQAESSSCRALEESGRQELSALRSAHQDACSTAHHLKQDLATARGKEREVAGVGRQLQEVCQLLKQERSDLLSKTSSQEQQLLAVRDKLSSVQRQLEVQLREAAGLTADKEGLLARLRSQEAESSEWEDRGREVEGRVHQLDVTNRSLQSKLVMVERGACQLRKDKCEADQRTAELKAELSLCREKEAEMLAHVKDSMQMVESSLLEKEQSDVREQQKLQEIERLKSVLSKVIFEAGEKARQEVATIRSELNESITEMAKEIQSLELECGEKQAVVERMSRQNKSLQQELHDARHSGPVESEEYAAAILELRARLRAAERAQTEALSQDSLLKWTVRDLEGRLEACRSAAAQDEQKSRLVCRQFEEDCDKLRRDNLELLQAREGLRGRLRAALQEGNSLQSSLDQQVNAVCRSKDLLEAEGAQHLQALEKKYKSKLQQLQLQLSTSQRKNTKCCSEAKALAHKFEHNLAELRSSCEGLRGHNADLAAAVDRARLEGQQLTEELVQVSRELSSCRDRLAEERSRADGALGEVAGLLERQGELARDRAALTHQLARVKLQLSKAFGEGPSLTAVS